MRFAFLWAACVVATNAAVASEGWPRHTIDNSSRGADGVRIADANSDGLPDVVTGWEEGGLIRAYFHPGKSAVRKPWPQITVGHVRSPEDAVFCDLDGDGRLEVVSSCEGKTRSMFLHWMETGIEASAESVSWKTATVASSAGRMWMYALALDVDGRHGCDLVVGSKGQDAIIGWLESPADPRAADRWRLHPIRQAGWIMSLITRDLDGDGDLDIVFSDRKGTRRGVSWLENPGSQGLSQGAKWTEHAVGGGDREVMFLDVADLDGDRREDIAVAVSNGPVTVFERTGDLARWNRVEIPMPANCGTGKSVAIGDIDLDGTVDIVFSCENATGPKSGVRWLRRSADSSWSDREISGEAGVKFDRVDLLDLDLDGDLDVMTCEERENLGVIWFENPAK